MTGENVLQELEEKGKEFREKLKTEDFRRHLDKLRYHAGHAGLLFMLAPGLRLWHFMMDPFYRLRSVPAFITLNKRMFELLDRDYENAEKGYYPKELLFEFFDEAMPKYLSYARKSLTDTPNILRRKFLGRFNDLPSGINFDDYPEYYRRTFHWQTDGWFSRHSARMYDGGVEFLFGGTADVMRRMVIPPVADAVKEKSVPKILDVACGTGRFLSTLKKALPKAKLFGQDLSPYYVDYARDEALSGVNGVQLKAGNAEEMSYKSDTFDVVTNIFLFHELPKDVRRAVMKEVLRVLKPGGTFVVLDSAQLSESPALKIFLEAFPVLYHEPYYKGYLRDDLADIMEECGFEVDESQAFFVSKRVVGRKPGKSQTSKMKK